MSEAKINYASHASDDGISLRDFIFFLWRSRWFALSGAATCAVVALLAAFIVTPEYTAKIELLPISSRSGSLDLGSLGSAVTQLSGLASMAGVSLGGAGKEKTEALATLQSRLLTEKYIEQHKLLPVLFSKKWNGTKQTWNTTDPKQIPTLWKANRLFKHDIRKVDDDVKTGLITLSIRWKNPALAAEWANGLVKLTNDYLRQRSISEAERSIDFLNKEVETTNIVEVKTAIYELMEAEIKKEMIARSRPDFALKVIDPAVPPQRESFPRPVLWTVGGGLVGLFFGLLARVLRETMADSVTVGGDDQHSMESESDHRGLEKGERLG